MTKIGSTRARRGLLVVLACALGVLTGLPACVSGDGGGSKAEATTLSVPGSSGTGQSISPPTAVAPQSDAPDTIWVFPHGNDANAGTAQEAPLRTIGRALAVAGPGDTIMIGAGTWPSLHIKDKAGAPGAPITIRSAPGAEGQVWFSAGNASSGFGVIVERSRHLVLDDLNASNSLWAVRIQASNDITYRNSEFKDIGQEAFTVEQASTNVLIEKNYIHHTGRVRPLYGEGIYLGNGTTVNDKVNGVTIRNNEIAYTTAEAIDMKPATFGITVEGNRIHDIATAASGAVVYGIGRDEPGGATNVVIRNNRIWNISTTSRWTDGNGISLSNSATVYNNVIWNVQHRGILTDGNFVGAREVGIYHNTVYNFGLAAIEVWTSPNPANADVRNNIGPNLPGNIASDPSLFVNAASGDFRLTQAATAAIGTGQPIPAVTRDAAGVSRGNAPDMGAYQLNGQAASSAPAPPPAPPETPTTTAPPPPPALPDFGAILPPEAPPATQAPATSAPATDAPAATTPKAEAPATTAAPTSTTAAPAQAAGEEEPDEAGESTTTQAPAAASGEDGKGDGDGVTSTTQGSKPDRAKATDELARPGSSMRLYPVSLEKAASGKGFGQLVLAWLSAITGFCALVWVVYQLDPGMWRRDEEEAMLDVHVEHHPGR